MSCSLGLPHIPLSEALASFAPLTIGISTPPFSADVNLCCKIFSISIPSLPISITLPIPGVVTALLAIISAAIAAINAFIDSLTFPCPLE